MRDTQAELEPTHITKAVWSLLLIPTLPFVCHTHKPSPGPASYCICNCTLACITICYIKQQWLLTSAQHCRFTLDTGEMSQLNTMLMEQPLCSTQSISPQFSYLCNRNQTLTKQKTVTVQLNLQVCILWNFFEQTKIKNALFSTNNVYICDYRKQHNLI